jgi:hypothetical protein
MVRMGCAVQQAKDRTASQRLCHGFYPFISVSTGDLDMRSLDFRFPVVTVFCSCHGWHLCDDRYEVEILGIALLGTANT